MPKQANVSLWPNYRSRWCRGAKHVLVKQLLVQSVPFQLLGLQNKHEKHLLKFHCFYIYLPMGHNQSLIYYSWTSSRRQWLLFKTFKGNLDFHIIKTFDSLRIKVNPVPFVSIHVYFSLLALFRCQNISTHLYTPFLHCPSLNPFLRSWKALMSVQNSGWIHQHNTNNLCATFQLNS